MTGEGKNNKETVGEVNEVELKTLLHKIYDERGMDFRDYKQSSLVRRLQKRLDAFGIASYKDYMKILDRDRDEYNRLFETLLINVTEFFRDPEAWEALDREVLAEIIASKEKGDSIRIWSAGCATGEEPYTIAILLAEKLGPPINDYNIRIYATDIDDSALVEARKGLFSEDKVKNLKPELVAKYFTRENNFYRINRNIRQLVIFGKQNLATDAPISHIDLLVCRNVLIYFNSDLQSKLLLRFHYALNRYGYTFFGKSESMLVGSKLFKIIDKKWRIFQKTNNVFLESPPAERRRAIIEEGMVDKALTETRHDIKFLDFYNQSIVQNINLSVIVLDRNNIVTTWNQASTRMWHIKPEDAVGSDFLGIGINKIVPEIIARLNESVRNRRPAKIEENEITDPDGQKRYVDISITPLIDNGDELRGSIIVSEDVTDERILRESLRRAVEEQQQLNAKLETGNQELESTNEELDTTMEELQSTSEELETSNEELQSTNEELETSNEELRSLNEELETTNNELNDRSEQLNEVNQYNKAIVDSIGESLIVIDKNSIITTWNPSAVKMFGITEKEAVGNSFYNLEPRIAINKDEIKRRIKEVMESKRPRNDEKLQLNSTYGESRFMQFSIIPLFEKNTDVPIGTLIILQDITEENKARDAMYRLTSIISSSDDAITSENEDGIIVSWNPAAERLYGYKAEDITGRPLSVLVPQDRIGELSEIFNKIKKGERIKHFSTSRRRKDGTEINISLTISPVRDKEGHIIGTSTIAHELPR